MPVKLIICHEDAYRLYKNQGRSMVECLMEKGFTAAINHDTPERKRCARFLLQALRQPADLLHRPHA